MVFLNAAHTLNCASVIHVALQQPPLNRLQVPAAQVLQGSCDDGSHPLFCPPILQCLLGELLGLARQLVDFQNKAGQRVGVHMVHGNSQGGNRSRLHA